MSAPHFLTPVLGASGPFGLRVVNRDTWLATQAQLAGSSESRRTGLLGKDALPVGHALVIAPTQGVHTFGMRFPLDLVGVRRDGGVVSLREAVPKRRLVFSLKAYAIVELSVGAIRDSGVRLGDTIEARITSCGTHEQKSSKK